MMGRRRRKVVRMIWMTEASCGRQLRGFKCRNVLHWRLHLHVRSPLPRRGRSRDTSRPLPLSPQ